MLCRRLALPVVYCGLGGRACRARCWPTALRRRGISAARQAARGRRMITAVPSSVFLAMAAHQRHSHDESIMPLSRRTDLGRRSTKNSRARRRSTVIGRNIDERFGIAFVSVAAGALILGGGHSQRPAEHPHRDVLARRPAPRALRARLLQAGRRVDRRQGQIPDLPGRHHRQPAEDHGIGAEEGGAGRPLLARLRLGHRQGRGDFRRLRRLAARRGAAALGLCRRRHRAVARVAPGEIRSGRASPAARTRTRSTCIRGSPSVPPRTSRG